MKRMGNRPGLPVTSSGSRSRWFYAALTLLVLSAIGLKNGYDEWGGAETIGQRVATITEIMYGLLGPLSALGLARAWPVTIWLLRVWALCISVTASLAAVVWGDAPIWSGLIVGVGAALISIWVIWMSRQPKRAST
jgi:hypothetical protein